MVRRRGAILLVALLAAFGYGLVQLFRLRYAAGDVYRPYSSLRSDPLGAKVLHDALEHVGSLEVAQNLRPLSLLRGNSTMAVLVLGVQPSVGQPAPPWLAEEIDRLARQGARIVLSLEPQVKEGLWGGIDQEEDKGTEKEEERETRGRRHQDPGAADLWGVRAVFQTLPADAAGQALAVPVHRTTHRALETELPEQLLWRSGLVFADLQAEWQPLYARHGRPVVITRRLGAGQLILASDSYFASNEALHEEPQPGLLAWLIGRRSRLVFEETHLGVQDDPGIVGLARRYGLHGLAAGLLVLAALIIWRASCPFLPPLEAGGGRRSPVTGRGTAEGLTDLLRRGIPTGDLLSACVDEWVGSSPERQRPAIRLRGLARQAPTTVEGYRLLSRALLEKREKNEH